MTAKQKAARAKFKAIVKEAGKLRKKNPKLTQAQAVKQAWAISYGKKKSASVSGVKKKTAKKKSAVKSYHKDTKSHNVNIRVISGIDDRKKHIISELNRTLNEIFEAEKMVNTLKDVIKYKKVEKEDMWKVKSNLKWYNGLIKEYKAHLRELKKNLK